jgi:transcriptional regulator with XRE-family HTH domain
MDTQKIGKFLKELRKEHDMTQEQLGERIGVTNKTVSRWETGNYMPPIESLKLLSDIYQISINEILSGERLDKEQYIDAAEENITLALEQIEAKNKKVDTTMFAVLVITTILAIVIIVLLPGGSHLTSADRIREIIVICLVWAMALISNTLNIVTTVLLKERND